nr:uncharacterized protein LOC127487444 [Oryctolagus cuniculus]
MWVFLKNIYLFESQSYTERGEAERERGLPSDGSLPNWLQCLSCADPKPGAWSFFQVSHVSAGAQGLGPSSTAFPGHSRELDWTWSSQFSKWHPYGIPMLQDRALTLCATAPAPTKIFKSIIRPGPKAHLANPPPAEPAPQVLVPVGAPDSVPIAHLPVQLSAVAQEGSEDVPSAWALHPHGRPGGSTWLLASDWHSVMAAAPILGVNQRKRKTFLSVSLSLTQPVQEKKNYTFRAGVVSWQVKPLPPVPACHMGASSSPSCSTSHPAPRLALGKQKRMTQVLGPLHHVGGREEAPGFSLAQPCPFAAIWGVNQ